MRLVRCHAQSRQTLDEFYAPTDEAPDGGESGRAMLSLLRRLRELPDPRSVWGLTSHQRLILKAEDRWDSPSYVMITACAPDSYFVSYRMPDDLAPWPEAHVNGEAQSEGEAVRMILIAMDRSGGFRPTADSRTA